MIYATESRAREVAALLNRLYGGGTRNVESRAVLTKHGWTVIGKWVW